MGYFDAFVTGFATTATQINLGRRDLAAQEDLAAKKRVGELDDQKALLDYKAEIERRQAKDREAEAQASLARVKGITPAIAQTAPAVLAPMGTQPANLQAAPAAAAFTDDSAQPFPISSSVPTDEAAPITEGTIQETNVMPNPVQTSVAPVVTMPTKLAMSPAPTASVPDSVTDEADLAYMASYKSTQNASAAALARQKVLNDYTEKTPVFRASQSMEQKTAEYNLAIANGADPQLAKEQYLGKAFGVGSEKPWQGGEEGIARAAEYGVPYAPDKAFERLSPELQEKRFEKDSAKLTAEQDTGPKSALNTALSARKLLGLTEAVNTGGFWALPGSEAFRTAFDTDAAQFVKIATEMSIKVRVPGSGSTSNFDLQQFQKSLPSLKIPNEANYTIAAGIIAQAERDKQYYEFQDSWLNAHGHYDSAKAMKEWNKYVNENPIFDPEVKGAPILNANIMSYSDWFAAGSPAQNKTAAVEKKVTAEEAQKDPNSLLSLWR